MTPLFAQKQSGDRAFERLYKAHIQDVYRYALMVLRNKADAEDVAQTTFLKAYRAYQRGERPRHPRQWLITIAHNTCRSHLRDGNRRPQEVELEEQVTSAAETKSEDAVDTRELVRALGALSFNQRSALVMRELEGRSYSEIADVLQISSSAVETLLFRARRAVREQLEGALSCGEAERALSLQLDGRLAGAEKGRLRAHLRECRECATLARRQRARQAVLRSLGPLPLPASLASWGGGTIGAGLGAKAAAIVAAGVAAAGAGYEAAEAVSEPVAHDRSSATTAPRSAAAAPVFAVRRAAAVAPAAKQSADRRAKRVAAAKAAKGARTGSDPAVAARSPRSGSDAVPAQQAAEPQSQSQAQAQPEPAASAPATLPVPVPVPKLPVETPTVAAPVALPEPPPVPVEVPALPAAPALPPPPVPLPEVPQLPSVP